MSKKKPDPLDAPALYTNRELSWLEFNDRVLRQGLNEQLPLLERLKFLAIVSSNLDEFFMIRVAGLMQQRAAGVRKRDLSGMTPHQQLQAISARVRRMVDEQTAAIKDVTAQLARRGLAVLDRQQWTAPQRRYLQRYFNTEVFPVLTPLAVQSLTPCPLLPGLQLQVALVLGDDKDAPQDARIVIIPAPGLFPRFVTLPGEEEGLQMARLEDVIIDNARAFCRDEELLAAAVLRITRDADVAIQEDEAADLLNMIDQAVISRRRRAPVRVEISAGADKRLRNWLTEAFSLRGDETYEIDGLLDAAALWQLVGKGGFEDLRVTEWPPQPPQDLIGSEDLWQTIQEHDVLLSHPYESFEPVVDLVAQAAADRNVLAIKQTLYRTSGDSPIIRALEKAAQNGKEVTVLVELKARFDEARNVNWARRLEDAGCHVIYGILGLKTHAKAVLIMRREGSRIRRYCHLATGNYNDKTARLYADVGLMTCNADLAADVAAFFNLLTGYSETVGWHKLAVAPIGLRKRFVELIEREIQASTPDRPGLIMAKVNSLQDKGIAQALYRAAQAGVEVWLNVRGICCLRPGVKGVSENLRVVSIVDRYLEHARVFYFANGGHEEVYLSSADWMGRNLDRRLELMFPVTDPVRARRLINMLRTCFEDNVSAWRLQADGSYHPVTRHGTAVRAQERLYQEAVAAARAAQQTPLRFRPMQRPEDADDHPDR